MSIIHYIGRLRAVFGALPRRHKRDAVINLLLLLLNSFIELLSLAVLFPVLSVLFDPSKVKTSKTLIMVKQKLTFVTDDNILLMLCGSLLLIILLKNLVSIFVTRYSSNFAFKLYFYYALKNYGEAFKNDILFFKNKNSSEIVRDINHIPLVFVHNFLLPLFSLFNEFIVLGSIVIIIGLYQPLILFLLLVVIVPIIYFVYTYIRRKIKGAGVLKNEISTEISKTLYQSVNGYVDITINGKERFFKEQLDNYARRYGKVHEDAYVLLGLPPKIIESGIIVSVILFVLVGHYMSYNISAIIGVFAIAAYRVLPSINRMLGATISMKEYEYALEIINTYKSDTSSEKEEETEHEEAEPMPFKNVIRLNDLVFSYADDVLILDHISFEIKRGESIGIIGKSGSGKSTLIQVLIQLLKQKEGTITVDGTEISRHNLRSWRRLIGYVQQDPFLLDGSISENIAFGIDPAKVDINRLNRAIDLASLRQLIDRLPNGASSLVGERGALLSGGQKQRICIARALYHGAELLIFDEATSALDNETEHEITDSVRKLSANAITSIIIAHRYSTLKYTDKIIELESGHIKNILTYGDIEANLFKK